jgi:alpha-tubulin suppressor-like RCC1 family protein
MPLMVRWRAVVAVLTAALLAVGMLAWAPVQAAFTGTTANSGNALTSAANFAAGHLYSWGGTASVNQNPVQVDSSAWSSVTAGAAWNTGGPSLPGWECGIHTDGTLWCWGTNRDGELGVGDTTNRPTPVQLTVPATTGWTSVSAGGFHTCATRSDSTLYCWGANGNGQLGVGDTTSRSTPTQVTVPATTGWSQVSTGELDTCAVRTDGSLYCWGINSVGQLGLGNTTEQHSPTQVPAPWNPPSSKTWTAVRLGWGHACALVSDSSLYCWGDNTNGRLGRGSVGGTFSSPQSVTVPSSTGWSSLGLGGDHSCALRSDSSLYCWGRNDYGQLGDGTTTDRSSPTHIGTATWTAVSGGYAFTCGIQTGSALYCWGENDMGQLGLGVVGEQHTPTQVGTATWSATLARGGSPRMISCAIRAADSTLWCWGDLGPQVLRPTQVGTDGTWSGLATGFFGAACGVRTDGTLWCWGTNLWGQLGLGNAASRVAPTQVTSPSSTGWSAVAAGARHVCALRGDTLWCWGYNAEGEIGNNTTTNQPTAVQVTVPAATGWASVSAGFADTCATRTDGSLYCWGSNGNGQLGLGNTTDQHQPAQVTTPSGTGWSSVGTGYQHVCATRTDGTLYCWGDGRNGRLGQGSTGSSNPTPLQVTAPSGTGWSILGLGADTSCAIRTDGSLYCWGKNIEGEVGNGNAPNDQNTPVQVGTATSWTTITGGYRSMCGTQLNRLVFCWGGNQWGELGLGDTVQRNSPVQIPNYLARPVVSGGTAVQMLAYQ